MKGLVVGEGRGVDLGQHGQTSLGLIRHGDRHSTVELNDGRWGCIRDEPVERCNLTPVGRCERVRLGVHRRDRSLQLIWTSQPLGLLERRLCQRDAFVYLVAIPQR